MQFQVLDTYQMVHNQLKDINKGEGETSASKEARQVEEEPAQIIACVRRYMAAQDFFEAENC